MREAPKPVLLEVAATWCGHCKEETKVLNRLFTKYRDDIEFVSVGSSPYGVDGLSPASRRDLESFDRVLKVRYPTAFDPSMTVAKALLAGGYPTIVIVDREKRVLWQSAGLVPFQDLDSELGRVAADQCSGQACTGSVSARESQ